MGKLFERYYMRTITIALTLMLVGCGQHKEEIKAGPPELVPEQYDEYTLEGCQYIVVGFGPQRWGSHKGNCNNSIHRK
jgi:hypothetical protein